MNINASEITPKNVSRAIGLGPRLKKRGGSEGREVTLPCMACMARADQINIERESTADAHREKAQVAKHRVSDFNRW